MKYVIYRTQDSKGIKSVNVFDFHKHIMVYYIECEQVMISGDKQYIWMLQEEKVYDIINGIATFFVWPGDQICTHAYSHMDAFNVLAHRTMLSTPGYLQLTFNMLSIRLNDQITQDYDFTKKDGYFAVPNQFQYFCYRYLDADHNGKSIMECMFKQDGGEDYSGLNEEEIKVKKEAYQMKIFQNLLAYFTQNLDAEINGKDKVASFFLSYYSYDVKERAAYKNIFHTLFDITQPRIDIIEDVLHYIVDALQLPIT